MPEVQAFIKGAGDAVARVLQDLRREAVQAEALRAAEHRAFMAEGRERLAQLLRAAEERIGSVRDGIDGKDGAAGRDGADGKDGANGKDGVDGTNGADGRDGADGKDGLDGRDGVDGKDGLDGRDGVDGKDGLDGRDGADGRDGVDGKDGADGRNGLDGKDAYPGIARGLHDPAAEYRALDVVSFNGCEWRARFDNPGPLPGDGWMLSASKGKRGERGDRGDRGPAGHDAVAAPGLVAGYVNRETMNLVLTREDGTELEVDLLEFATMIRGA